MAHVDKLYHNLAQNIIDYGYRYKTDNRPQDCVQISSANMEISLREFPLLTTKKMFTKGIVEELLWFLRGENSIKPLLNKEVSIWNQDAYNYYKKFACLNGGEKQNQILFQNPDDSWRMFKEEEFPDFVRTCPNVNYAGYTAGDVGRNYGVQWRTWTNIMHSGDGYVLDDTPQDQIANLLYNLRKPNPINRRHIVTAWNPAELNDTALPPCHWAFEIIPKPLKQFERIEYSGKDQVYLEALWKDKTEEAKEILNEELKHVPHYGFILKWHQRSVDTFLG